MPVIEAWQTQYPETAVHAATADFTADVSQRLIVAPTIDAVNDGPTAIPSTGGNTPSVIGNDTTNGQPVVLSGAGTNATLIPGTAPTPVAGSIS